MIWVAFLVMALVASAFALLPIFRPDTAAVIRSDAVPAVLADQLEEVRRDLDRGLISAAEAKAAELEIKKRILSVVRRTTSEEHGPGAGGGRAGAILAALFVPLMAFGYYTVNGAPDVPALAFGERAPSARRRPGSWTWRSNSMIACRTIRMAARAKAGCFSVRPTCGCSASRTP